MPPPPPPPLLLFDGEELRELPLEPPPTLPTVGGLPSSPAAPLPKPQLPFHTSNNLVFTMDAREARSAERSLRMDALLSLCFIMEAPPTPAPSSPSSSGERTAPAPKSL